MWPMSPQRIDIDTLPNVSTYRLGHLHPCFEDFLDLVGAKICAAMTGAAKRLSGNPSHYIGYAPTAT